MNADGHGSRMRRLVEAVIAASVLCVLSIVVVGRPHGVPTTDIAAARLLAADHAARAHLATFEVRSVP